MGTERYIPRSFPVAIYILFAADPLFNDSLVWLSGVEAVADGLELGAILVYGHFKVMLLAVYECELLTPCLR